MKSNFKRGVCSQHFLYLGFITPWCCLLCIHFNRNLSCFLAAPLSLVLVFFVHISWNSFICFYGSILILNTEFDVFKILAVREFKGIFELVENTFQVFGHCFLHEWNILAGTLMALLLIELPFWLCWGEWSPLNNNWHILYLWMTTVSNSSTTVINCSLVRFLKWQLILSYCKHNF